MENKGFVFYSGSIVQQQVLCLRVLCEALWTRGAEFIKNAGVRPCSCPGERFDEASGTDVLTGRRVDANERHAFMNV